MTTRMYAAATAVLLAATATAPAAFELDEKTNQIVLRNLASFDRCVLDLSEIPECLDALRRYASKRLNDSFQAGKRARMHYESWTALYFFDIAFRKQATDAQCGDEDVVLAVVSGLSRPAADQATLQLARDISNKCWDGLKDGLIEAAASPAPNFLANACPLLQGKGESIAACQAPAENAAEPHP